MGGVAPAAVAAGDYLQIDKSVDKPLPLPGDTFTYSVKVTCSEVDCLDTQLTDVLPAALAGFPIEDVVFTPQTTPIVVTWSSDIPSPARNGTNWSPPPATACLEPRHPLT